jgi:hypothetical protein
VPEKMELLQKSLWGILTRTKYGFPNGDFDFSETSVAAARQMEGV